MKVSKMFPCSMSLHVAKPTRKQVEKLESILYQEHNPDKILDYLRSNPALASTLVDPCMESCYNDRGHLAIFDLLKLPKVELRHVVEYHDLMSRSALPWGALSVACSEGCDPGIILFILRKSTKKEARTKDVNGNLPLFYLLESCGPQHLPALEALLSICASKVKLESGKYYSQALANSNCPRKIKEQLDEMHFGS